MGFQMVMLQKKVKNFLPLLPVLSVCIMNDCNIDCIQRTKTLFLAFLDLSNKLLIRL